MGGPTLQRMAVIRAGWFFFLAVSLKLARTNGDELECMRELVNDCQAQAMMMLAADDKTSAANALKQCVQEGHSGEASDCNGIITADGQLSADMQEQIKACGMEAMKACPAESMQATSVAIKASNLLKGGQQIDPATLKLMFDAFGTVFTCLKERSNQLSDTCSIIAEVEIP